MASKLIDRILDAATWEFANRGFAGAATKAIAARADVTEGSLFRLFGSKEQLFTTVFRRAVDSSPATTIVRHFNGLSFADAIRKSVRSLWDDVSPELIRLVDVALLERPKLATSVYLADWNTATGIVVHAMEDEKKAGRIRKEIQPEAAISLLFLAIVRYRFVMACRPPGTRFPPSLPKDPRVLDEFVDLWLKGVTCEPEQKRARKLPKRK